MRGCVCVCVCVYVCMYVWLYVWLYVCMYVCIYLLTCICLNFYSSNKFYVYSHERILSLIGHFILLIYVCDFVCSLLKLKLQAHVLLTPPPLLRFTLYRLWTVRCQWPFPPPTLPSCLSKCSLLSTVISLPPHVGNPPRAAGQP